MIALYILGGIAGLCALLCLVYLLLLVRPVRKKHVDARLLCNYAHRGLHGDGVPENSLAAFERACEAGYGIELDVQLSSDGEVMVFHDATLVRMTGCDQKLCELTAKELKDLSLAESDQRIPTFREVLALVNGRVPLLVELKGESYDTSLCEKVAPLLAAYQGPYCIESFSPLLVRNIQKLLPDAFCGLLYTNVCREKKKASALNLALSIMALNILARPQFIAYNKKDRTSLPVKLTTGLYRVPAFVWTTRPKDEDALRDCPAHRIFEKQ